MTADEVVALLGLSPHPEGGWYRETFRDQGRDGGADGGRDGARGASTAIYYLLAAGQRSHWHRVDAAEVWHHYAGAPLKLLMEDGPVILGKDLAQGQRPQAVVPPHGWQAAEPLGDWTLVGCTVAPAFDFATFEMAPPGWSPPKA